MDFSRLLSDFPVFFKAGLIFKDFSRKLSKFKYFSSLCKPCCLNVCVDVKSHTKSFQSCLGISSGLNQYYPGDNESTCCSDSV